MHAVVKHKVSRHKFPPIYFRRGNSSLSELLTDAKNIARTVRMAILAKSRMVFDRTIVFRATPQLGGVAHLSDHTSL
jgi:hypothetical protein